MHHDTECVTDLDQQSEMISTESLLKQIVFFEASEAVAKIGPCQKQTKLSFSKSLIHTVAF